MEAPAPVILAVDEDPQSLSVLERELTDRYARSYRVVCVASAEEARAQLEAAASAGEEAALVLAPERLGGRVEANSSVACGAPPSGAARTSDRVAQLGGRQTGTTLFRAMARRQIENYVIRPSRSPDELFHQSVSSSLLEWAHAGRVSPNTVHVVADSWSGRAYELRSVLGRCAIPHAFVLADSDHGSELVTASGGGGQLPLVVFPNGATLAAPGNLELASAVGATIDPDQREFDVVIIGAGPAGLSAAVYGASEGLRTLVVDEGGIGGQATSSSLIRNYLGFPRGVAGRRLAEQRLRASVGVRRRVRVHEPRDLAAPGRRPPLRRSLLRRRGQRPRRHPRDRRNLSAARHPRARGPLRGGRLLRRNRVRGAGMAGSDVFVLGGANSAGQAALHLAEYARQVTMVVRAASLEAAMSDYLMRQIEAAPNIEVRLGTEVVGGGGEGWLERLVLRGRADGAEETVRADALFVMIGAQPNTDWLPDGCRACSAASS